MKEEWKEILPALYQRASVQSLKEFIHLCAEDISGRKPAEFEAFSTTGWTKEEFDNAVLHSKLFLVDAVTGNYDSQSVEAALPALDKQIVSALSNCVNVRGNELKESLLVIAAKTPGTSLRDFDWKLKWVLGSSSLSTLQEHLLSVNLHLDTKTADNFISNLCLKNTKQSSLNIELDRTELDSLISSLENVEDSPQR